MGSDAQDHDEQQRERGVLRALIEDPAPWTVGELVRDAGPHGDGVTDAIAALEASGLVHRYVVSRRPGHGMPEDEIVFATRAARRADELSGGAL